MKNLLKLMFVMCLLSFTAFADGNMGSGGLCEIETASTKAKVIGLRDKESGELGFFGEYLESILDLTGFRSR